MCTIINFWDILHKSSFVYIDRPVETVTVYCNYMSLTDAFLQQTGIIEVISHNKSMEKLPLSGL